MPKWAKMLLVSLIRDYIAVDKMADRKILYNFFKCFFSLFFYFSLSAFSNTLFLPPLSLLCHLSPSLPLYPPSHPPSFSLPIVGDAFGTAIKAYREMYSKLPAGEDDILVALEKDMKVRISLKKIIILIVFPYYSNKR